MTKDLKDKAIDIKGKKYVQVADRIIYFNEQYPEGSIMTILVSDAQASVVVMKAVVTPKQGEARQFTGYAQEIIGDGMVNKTSALENAETSAVGRALGMMGIGVIDGVASVDEINKATNRADVKTKTCTVCGVQHHQKMGDKCYDCWKQTKS